MSTILAMALAIEQVAPKVRNEIRNKALEEAAKLAETSKGYPTEISEKIRGLKR